MEWRHDESDWTVVDYRRGRNTQRGHATPQNMNSYSRHHHPDGRHHSNGQHSNGHQRSYASVTRAVRGTQRENYPQRPTKEPGYKPQFFDTRYPNGYQNAKYNNSTKHSTVQYNKYKPRTNIPRTTEQTRTQEKMRSEDPDFLIKVRSIHLIIKTIHHLHNVSSTDPPPTIARMSNHLSTFIKPAGPSPNTQMLIEGNAKNWAFTSMLILRDHYKEVMEAEVNKLKLLSTHHWQGPLDMATSWARRNLGRRLRAETVKQVEALLTANLTDHPATTSASSEHGVGPTAVGPSDVIAVAQVHAPVQNMALTTYNRTLSQPPVLSTPIRETVTVATATGTQIHAPKQNMATHNQPLSQPPVLLTPPRETWTVATATQGHSQEAAPKQQRTARSYALIPRPPARPLPTSPPPTVVSSGLVMGTDPFMDLTVENIRDSLYRPSPRSPIGTRSLTSAVQTKLSLDQLRQLMPKQYRVTVHHRPIDLSDSDSDALSDQLDEF